MTENELIDEIRDYVHNIHTAEPFHGFSFRELREVGEHFALPREKRIEELEETINKLREQLSLRYNLEDKIKELKADNDARKFAMAMSEKVEKQLREENTELKSKLGLSIDCEKAQKNGELCLGYGGDEDEPLTERKLYQLWKDGAEFGYNKANEWHYPSKGELPKETGRYLILNRFGDHYFTTNITEYLEGAKLFSTFSMEDVYAWKEIVLPELKESE